MSTEVKEVKEQEVATVNVLKEAGDILYDTFTSEETKEGHKESLGELGSFEKIRTKERTGRNPKTGEEINIPAKFNIRFKSSNKLKKEFKNIG